MNIVAYPVGIEHWSCDAFMFQLLSS